MNSRLLAPKWQEFHSSLACMLNMSTAMVDCNGNLKALYNPRPPLSLLDSNSYLAQEYRTLFHSFLSEQSQITIKMGPLGYLHAGILLDDNCCLILCAGLERDNPVADKKFKSGYEDYGLAQVMQADVRDWCTLEEVNGAACRVLTLYNRLNHSISESSEMGQEGILLAALDEINSLMVGLLTPESYDLRRILDLVASSLVILLDAQGAWVFTQAHTRTVTVARGEASDLLDKMARMWTATPDFPEDFCPFPSTLTSNQYSVYPLSIKLSGSVLSLGVLNPREIKIQPVLSAFGRQVAIALEMDSMYNVLQRRLGELFNSIRHGMLVINCDGVVMVMNRAAEKVFRELGKLPQLGEHLNKLALCPEIEKAMCGAVTGLSFFRKQSLLCQDTCVHLIWDAAPIRGNKGEIVGAILLFEDITETLSLTRQLKEWERLATAGEVAAGLAHEIRNPLAAARGALQLFEMVDGEEQRQELLMRFAGELDRMNSILTEYLSLSKTPEGDEISPVNLAEVINDIKYLFNSEALLYNVDLQVRPCGKVIPNVLGNSSSLKQVFLNIGKNALEAMANGGSLTVTLDSNGTHAWAEFTDNGPGIPSEHIDNIFRPFFTTKIGGTGLGLAISNKIIKRMDGEIQIKSAPGIGTTVTVVLPVQRNSKEEIH